MTRYHTGGDVCTATPCAARWHTQYTPVPRGLGASHVYDFSWPPGTEWTLPGGDVRVSPKEKECPAPDYEPEPEPELLPRASALREAEKLTCGDRNNDYGPPTQDFQRTADLLNSLGYVRLDAEEVIREILPSDVAIMIAQVKMSRLMHSRGKRDNWVDLAGYAGCGYECAVEEAAR